MERPAPSAIPATPGVYIYKDAGGRIIYVGKARNLRRRVLSYFRPADQLTAKTAAMIGRAAGIEFLTTTTEKEALLLEASLIKKHRPHYNICLRDDKQYVMFRLSEKDPFPRLEIVRRMKKRDGARYFGPFTAGLAARETWKTIHRIFPLRRCSDRAMKNRQTPCLYHHIHLCSAPCTGEITARAYADLTKRVALLLSGKSTELVDTLKKAMEEASEHLEFERAASLRDQIRAIEKTVEKQAIVLQSGGDMDVLGLVSMPDGLALGVVFVRHGLVQDRSAFFWPGLGLEDASELLWSFLGQFYQAERSIPPRIVLPYLPWEAGLSGSGLAVDSESALVAPHASASMGSPFLAGDGVTPCFLGEDTLEVSVSPSDAKPVHAPSLMEQAAALIAEEDRRNASPSDDGQDGETGQEALEAVLTELRGGPVRIAVPRNDEERRLLDMARSNARESAKNRKDASLADRLAAAFHFDRPVIRVECADVSHTGGESTKVGAVIYEDGRPLREDYRVWNIEGADGDDYAALSMWAKRRLEHGEPWPDLLLIDGGRGQLAAVHRILVEELAAEENGRLPFLLAGIAKARDERGHADRRAGNVADRIFVPGRSNPLPLREGCPELLFLQVVRDAAHDFSIGRHRQARARQAFSGELRQLPGIGMKTAQLLWEHFDSVADMKAAPLSRLMDLPGIGKKKAEAIRDALQKL
ncbi:excinuclease ABC subunit UvrC [uncultured Mailhella sp.]|uniref:excinuclease ABC subunit UvrC n=1 Tax=uncultured Mailhella sp. TaxID=1981031 RepID=UPI0025CEF7BD|nr:excinuclease ABC subunit UvrC [uncultured Mailhella sp.]